MARHPHPPKSDATRFQDLPRAFGAAAALYSDRVAIMVDNTPTTYGALAQAVDAFATEIAAASPTVDPVVAIDAADHAKQWLAILAVIRLGWQSVSGRLTPDAQDRLRVSLLVTDGALPAHAGRPNLPRLTIPKFEDLIPSSEMRASEMRALRDHPGRVIMSSGTTGTAKPVLLDGEALRKRLALYHDTFAVDPTTVAAPLLGCGTNPGFFMPLACWMAGGQIVLPATQTPAGLAGAVAHANLVLASPLDLERVLDAIDGVVAADPKRRTFVAGGRLAPRLRDRIARCLGPNIVMMYGSAEAAWVCRGDAALGDHNPGAVGFPLAGVEVEIVDDHDRPVPAGAEGRVRIRSRNVVAPARAANGWFYPGDLGARAAGGLLCITGRVDDVLNVGGAKVAPAPLEAALQQIPEVREAAVALVHTTRGAERLAVATVTPTTANWPRIEALIGSIMRGQPPYLNVRVETLPRGEMGKLDRRALAEQLTVVARAVETETS